MQSDMGPAGGPEEGQAVSIGDEPVARRTKREVVVARERDAQRSPVQAPIEHAEAARVHVGENPLLLQRGEVEWEALHLGGRGTDSRRDLEDPPVHRSECRHLGLTTQGSAWSHRVGGWHERGQGRHARGRLAGAPVGSGMWSCMAEPPL